MYLICLFFFKQEDFFLNPVKCVTATHIKQWILHMHTQMRRVQPTEETMSKNKLLRSQAALI